MYGNFHFSICTLLLLMQLSPGIAMAVDNSFSFIALGDTAYTEESYPEYLKLIHSINEVKPVFTIHLDDILGYQECSDENYSKNMEFFDEYNHPVIYTPGDNEWTDCRDKSIDITKNATTKVRQMERIR